MDSVKEFVAAEGSYKEVADSYKTLEAMATELLSSWERFKVQQAAATSSPSTTTPPSTAPVPPPAMPKQALENIESAVDHPLKLHVVPELSMPAPAKCSTECLFNGVIDNTKLDDVVSHELVEVVALPMANTISVDPGDHRQPPWPPPLFDIINCSSANRNSISWPSFKSGMNLVSLSATSSLDVAELDYMRCLKKPYTESIEVTVNGLISRGASLFQLWRIPWFNFLFLDLTSADRYGLALFQWEIAWKLDAKCFDYFQWHVAWALSLSVTSTDRQCILAVVSPHEYYPGVHYCYGNVFEGCPSAYMAMVMLLYRNYSPLNSWSWYTALHCTTASVLQICTLNYGNQRPTWGIISGAFLKCNNYICCWYALKPWSPLVCMVYTYWLLQEQVSTGVDVLAMQCITLQNNWADKSHFHGGSAMNSFTHISPLLLQFFSGLHIIHTVSVSTLFRMPQLVHSPCHLMSYVLSYHWLLADTHLSSSMICFVCTCSPLSPHRKIIYATVMSARQATSPRVLSYNSTRAENFPLQSMGVTVVLPPAANSPDVVLVDPDAPAGSSYWVFLDDRTAMQYWTIYASASASPSKQILWAKPPNSAAILFHACSYWVFLDDGAAEFTMHVRLHWSRPKTSVSIHLLGAHSLAWQAEFSGNHDVVQLEITSQEVQLRPIPWPSFCEYAAAVHFQNSLVVVLLVSLTVLLFFLVILKPEFHEVNHDDWSYPPSPIPEHTVIKFTDRASKSSGISRDVGKITFKLQFYILMIDGP